MKKILSLAIMALTMSACSPTPQKADKKFHVEAHEVHHFADGRVGYRDEDGIWWYLMLNNQMTSATASSPTISGGWSKGAAPTQAEINEADVETQGVVETAEGDPVDATEAAAVAEADPSIADTVATEATGEISATVDISASAEGSVDTGSTDTGSVDTSVDTGSYDSGGGFDSGGGDVGGGGGE